MTIIEKIAPLSVLGMSRGDSLVGFDMTPTSIIFRIAIQNPQKPITSATRSNALARFSRGSSGVMNSTVSDIEDARFAYLRDKHVK